MSNPLDELHPTPSAHGSSTLRISGTDAIKIGGNEPGQRPYPPPHDADLVAVLYADGRSTWEPCVRLADVEALQTRLSALQERVAALESSR